MSALHFAQIREDSRLERELALHRELRRLVVIASGGCTAFSLLDDHTEEVVAIDSSEAQCALVSLKAAALAHFARDTFLVFLGEAGETVDASSPQAAEARDLRVRLFRELTGALSPALRDHWDARPELIAMGLNHAGTTERFYRFLGGNLSGTVRPEATWRELLRCSSLKAQAALSERHFQDDAFRLAVRVLLSRTSHLAFFPAFMFAAVTEHAFGDHFLSCFDQALRGQPLAGNYFLSQLLWGRYLPEHPEGLPPYLTEEGYARARRNIGKLRVVPATLETFLAQEAQAQDRAQQRDRAFDGFFLSNVFDWADAAGRERIAATVAAAAAPGAAVLFRHMLAAPAKPPTFVERLTVDERRSADFTSRERALCYRSVVVGNLP